MSDHPFDDVAVEAARVAYATMERRIFNGLENGDIELEPVHAALTAAFKSMKDRGMAREGGLIVRSDDKWVVTDFWNQNEIPVTIIRHKENGDGK